VYFGTQDGEVYPWLAPKFLPNWNLNAVFYIGRRSPFTHPMLADIRGPFDGWPAAYVLENRKTGELRCAHCFNRHALVPGQVAGVESCRPHATPQ
jgi:hypothetical protein